MSLKRVVVTGMGALTPIGNNVPDFWNSLISGKSGAGPITRFDASKFKTRFACEVKNLDIPRFIDRKDMNRMDLFSQYAVIASDEALQDAGLLDILYKKKDGKIIEDQDDIDLERIGVIWGSGIGGTNTFFSQSVNFANGDGTPRFVPLTIPKLIASIAPGLITMRYGIHGISFLTMSACASSNHAIIDALNYIRLGKADIIIAGGSEASVNEIGVGSFNSLQALSTRNDDPLTASRPFDKDRDGFVMGEGAGALILEEYEHAIKRGAKIYAEVAGGGISSDAYHLTAPHPDGLGAQLVIKNALADANLGIQDIDYINLHGTSTPIGDGIEVKAIQEVFKEHAYNINLSSTKSMLGHLLGASGAIEAIASIKALLEGIIPPTINHFTDDESIDNKLNFTFNKAQKRDKMRAAISNTFGFGGHNTCVVLKKLG